MEVKVAKTAGFCFGVQRAVDKVYELIGSCPDRLFTLGPIIHNEEVVNDLEKKGVRVASEDDLRTLPEGSTVVIRSHGVGKEVYDHLEEYGLSYVDVTCPFVLKIHRIVEKESRAGAHIVIIGDPDHPEVVGICGWCMGPYTVIRTEQDALDFVFPIDKNICKNCGRCVGKCPFHTIEDGAYGYKIYIGGRWGKKVSQGKALGRIFTSKEEALDVIEKAILFFRDNGIKGERFAETIERIGFENVEKQLLEQL